MSWQSHPRSASPDESTAAELAEALGFINAKAKRSQYLVGPVTYGEPTEWDKRHELAERHAHRLAGAGPMTDYRTLAIINALTSLGVELDEWQVEALDRMMLASAEAEDDGE